MKAGQVSRQARKVTGRGWRLWFWRTAAWGMHILYCHRPTVRRFIYLGIVVYLVSTGLAVAVLT